MAHWNHGVYIELPRNQERITAIFASAYKPPFIGLPSRNFESEIISLDRVEQESSG